jgi:hypothetical protein
MNFKNLMIATAIATICFGVGFIISPTFLGSLYGITTTVVSEFALRLYATALIGIGILAWLFRQTQNREVKRAILIAFMVIDGGGFFVALTANLGGIMNAFGWSLVVIFFLFTTAFAFLLFQQQRTD